MIFDTEILQQKVVGFHYNLICLLPKDSFNGGKYGENMSLEELRQINFTNYQELQDILTMLNKIKMNTKVNLGKYEFNAFNDSYSVLYDNNEILNLDRDTLIELGDVLNDSNSSICKSQYCADEFKSKAQFIKDKYNCHEMSNSDVLLFVDSNNEWRLNEIKV